MRAAELTKAKALRAEDVAFRLAPRINAAGRLGHARLAVELLVTSDQRRAAELADYLNEQNANRQSIERRIYREAAELLSKRFDPATDRAIVLGRRGWHVGVIGIVAARLVDRFWRPVILVSLDGKVAQGSGRSIPGFDMYQALRACANSLVSFGGHQMAAGLRIEPEALPEFSESFQQVARERIGDEELAERIEIDAEVPLGDVNHKLVHYIEQLGPFGCGNPRPLLMAARVQVVGEPRKVGGGERHLQFRIGQHGVVLRAVAFGMAERAEELQRGRLYDVAFRPQINTFGGVNRVDLHVEDFRPCEQ
jgi:single-stranded-DNA-specific exonuclease